MCTTLRACVGNVTCKGQTLPPKVNPKVFIASTEPLPAHLLKQILYEETAERIHALGKISDAEGSLVRTFFSPAHIRAASQVHCDV